MIDDRGTSATLPADFLNDEPRAPPAKKRRGEDDEPRRPDEVSVELLILNTRGCADLKAFEEQKRSRPEPAAASSTSKLEEARALKSKAPKSEA